MNPKYYLRKWPNAILKKKCDKVTDFSELDELVQSMDNIAKSSLWHAFGISAPQIGDSRRVFITYFGREKKVFVNPEILRAKGFVPSLEGCLSFPFFIILPKIRRYSVEVAYQDQNGTHKQETFKGFDATIIQHENDHLNGKLIVNYF